MWVRYWEEWVEVMQGKCEFQVCRLLSSLVSFVNLGIVNETWVGVEMAVQ
jgi:hypothetical protein